MNSIPYSAGFINGDVAFWYRDVPTSDVARPPLRGNLDVDVAIVGGGFTGLWSAYYLKKAHPDLRIAVLEARFAGFGASGRNGGWLSAEPPGQPRRYAKAHGWPATVAMQQHMFSTVDEVIRVTQDEGIDAEIDKTGVLHIAANAAQAERMRHHTEQLRTEGWAEQDLIELTPRELFERIYVPGARLAQFTPHGARIQPAKLARGLAEAVERLGVTIYEDTPVAEVIEHKALTGDGAVRADYVLLATEGFTAGIKGRHFDMLPMNSSMLVTEPLPKDIWAEIGWRNGELIGDAAHSFAYMQRTPDGRIVVGGRGVPYKFGSKTDNDGTTSAITQGQLHHQLEHYFPSASQVPIAHAWSGVLGVPRDWCASVAVNHTTGVARAGGYVGHGVAGTNLAGRTVADLVLRKNTDLTHLPWVDRRIRRWEPEPLRWIGAQAMYAAYRQADRNENAGSTQTSRLATIANVISGR